MILFVLHSLCAGGALWLHWEVALLARDVAARGKGRKKRENPLPCSLSWQSGKDLEFFSPVFPSFSNGGGWKLKFGSSLCTG